MIHLSQTLIETPLGDMKAIASKQGLFILSFQEEQSWIEERINRFYPNSSFSSKYNDTLESTCKWLTYYFENDSKKQKESLSRVPPFDLQGTSFSTKVWHTLCCVAKGTTLTYGELANRAGSPKGARAVGQIVGNNPIAILIPCHRILGANNKLTGFRSGLDRKIWLLNHEAA